MSPPSLRFRTRLARALAAAQVAAVVVACGSSSSSPRHVSPSSSFPRHVSAPGCVEHPESILQETCVEHFRLRCGLPAEHQENVALPPEVCARLCAGSKHQSGCGIVEMEGPALYCFSCVDGRRPAGLVGERDLARTLDLGSFFAHAAFLEGASIDAFYILADELREHGAPTALVRGAARAARDEVRHARAMGRLARRFGGEAHAVIVERRGARSLEEIAIENAVEGCVRETYGALVAAWQAANAGDPEVRAVLRGIARDEARHAALAWDVAGWAASRLDDAANARVRAAQIAALEEIAREVRVAPSASMRTIAGLPSRESAERLVAAMRDELFAARAA